MNPFHYQTTPAPPHPNWFPIVPPNPPPSSTFWSNANVHDRLRELHETLHLAKAMQKELEMLMKFKEAKGSVVNEDNGGSAQHSALVDEFSKFLEDNRTDFEVHESVAIKASNELMSRFRSMLDPFRIITNEMIPWEEKSAAVRLADKLKKSKRNKLWRKKKRKRVAEKIVEEREKFEELDREADEWRAREIAKTIAQRKVEKMKEIAKQKAKEEKRRLESELELVLMVEKLQELRSLRIEKLKKQGHFFPEEDDKFLERVQAAVEEEERQARAAADTDAAKDAIASAEESRKVIQGIGSDSKDQSNEEVEESNDQTILGGEERGSVSVTNKESGNYGLEGPSYRTYDYVANLPSEFYHYYHGSNTDMGTLIEVRRTWDAYIKHGGSRIPGHWVQPPPPADEIWASYLVPPK